MDQKYPELFRSREASADFSVLSPCAQLPRRFSRVRDLSLTFLGPPPASSELHSPLGAPHCSAIHAPSFYQAFNSYSRDLYEFRKANKIAIRTPPILFDLSGQLLSEKILRRFARKGALFVKMPSSCQDIRKSPSLLFCVFLTVATGAALAQCLQESDCVMIQRNKPGDCLRPPLIDTMPTKCQQLKKGYGECKRGMVDMRKRFRGNQPIAVSKEIEGGAQDPGHQLYAGKPAFSSTAKETSGNEPIEKDWRELENEKFRKGL
jgi:cytochrome c oxidase assembly factor 5